MSLLLIVNCFVIMLFIITLIKFYNKYPNYFITMSIILIYWFQLIISSAYIETGVYLKDIGKMSYGTGLTIRLFFIFEFCLLFFMYLIKKFGVKDNLELKEKKVDKKLLFVIECLLVYRFLDILISGNIFTNANVTRFNYFSEFSKLPFAQIIDYFSYPFMWILGISFVSSKSNYKKMTSLFYFLLNIFCLILRGIQFGAFLQVSLYFLIPTLIELSKNKKIFKIKYIVVVSFLLLVMLIPKYNHFVKLIDSGYADKSYGLNTATDFIIYRALAQEADLTWEIDRQVWEESYVDPNQYFIELKSIIGINKNDYSGVKYLMKRGLSDTSWNIYNSGSAVVTGGYPYIWIAIFGYFFGLLFILFDMILLFLLINLIVKSIQKEKFIILIMAAYLLCQCYTIIQSGNLSIIGNTIPAIFIVLLLFFHNKTIKVH